MAYFKNKASFLDLLESFMIFINSLEDGGDAIENPALAARADRVKRFYGIVEKAEWLEHRAQAGRSNHNLDRIRLHKARVRYLLTWALCIFTVPRE